MVDQNYTPAPAADFVLPFSMPEIGVRGRLVRLDSVSTRALSAHELPESAGRTLAEALVLTAMLGSSLKLDGRLTVQTKGVGPLDLLTADYYGSAEQREHAGLRGYARVDESRLDALGPESRAFEKLTGDGVFAITIEPKLGDQSYQGIVPLSAGGIAASAEGYFAQSEQLPTTIKLAAGQAFVPGNPRAAWRAGGIMLQAIPDSHRDDDDWERLSLFIETVEDLELLDTSLAAEDLLWRLFHEDAVRVHAPEPLDFHCGCDSARIAAILQGYSQQDRDALADPDGQIRARCEFCGAVHAVCSGPGPISFEASRASPLEP